MSAEIMLSASSIILGRGGCYLQQMPHPDAARLLKIRTARLAVAASILALVPADAFATRLEIPADAPEWAHWGAAALLIGHIGGGSLGILSGAVALGSRKGARVHRAAGAFFFAVMFVCYAIALVVAPFLSDGQITNSIAGASALYLLISGVATARRGAVAASRWHVLSLLIALSIGGACLYFNHLGALTPEGSIDGSPPEALAIFIIAAAIAGLGELHVLLRGRLPENARIARHLWRMCFSLFIASGSFFLGQQQVMPEWMKGSPVLIVLALAPLALMVFWLIRIRIGLNFKIAAPPG